MIDFLCIGAQKSGTTLLYEHLSKIEEVCFPAVKELHFFDNDINYFKGKNHYLKNFIHSKKDEIKGEITPAYLFFDKVPRRIKETIKNQDLKFIVILRNPIDRAYSQYNMSKFTQKHEKYSFEQALIYENYRQNEYKDFVNFSYIQRGFYSKQILNYFKYFKKENFKFIIFEDFVTKQEQYINEILQFVRGGGGMYYQIENKKVFSNEYTPMEKSIREILSKIYEEEITLLENIIDIDLSIWRETI